MVNGKWYLVSGIWYLVSGIWYLVSGIWYLVSGIWYLVYGIWYMVYGIWYLVYGIWYMVYGTVCGIWYVLCGTYVVFGMVYGIWYSIWYIWYIVQYIVYVYCKYCTLFFKYYMVAKFAPKLAPSPPLQNALPGGWWLTVGVGVGGEWEGGIVWPEHVTVWWLWALDTYFIKFLVFLIFHQVPTICLNLSFLFLFFYIKTHILF